MWNGLPSALQFARAWRSPSPEVASRRVVLPLPGDAAPVPGTVVARAGSRGTPGWVVLHGLTRKGRNHDELVRFTQALASTGGRVVVPEIPEWVDLRFAPQRARTVIGAAVDWMHGHPDTTPGGVLLVGFSFGGPQALLAAADPEIGSKLKGVVSWGGYAEIERVLRFSFTGEHEWEDEVHYRAPDPYVRWIIGANCLPLHVAGEEGARISKALFTLAREAGDRGIRSGDPVYDPTKEELRERLPAGERALFDLFAPRTGTQPERREAERLIQDLAPLMRERIPMIEPLSLIGRIDPPVRLLHGRADDLIPYTESLRLERALQPKVADLETRVTGLFSHAGEDGSGSVIARAGEGLQFLGALRRIFEMC